MTGTDTGIGPRRGTRSAGAPSPRALLFAVLVLACLFSAAPAAATRLPASLIAPINCAVGSDPALQAVRDLTTSAGSNLAVASRGSSAGPILLGEGTGSITGTLKDANNVPLQGMEVDVYASVADYNNGIIASWSGTDGDGEYEASGLPAGSYIVDFTDNGMGDYVHEFYDDAATIESATLVSLATGETKTGIDATFPAVTCGHIKGTVTNADNVPLQGMEVDVYASVADYNNGVSVSWSGTDADGHYDLGYLSTGSYIVDFTDNGMGDYVHKFYDDAATIESATLVAVTAGETKTGIDATFPAVTCGHIKGTVTNEDGDALPNMKVYAFASVPDYYDGVLASWAGTDADGDYDLGYLATGSYLVTFLDQDQGLFVPEWFDNKLTIESAIPVAATAGASTVDINATLVAAGSIAGTVTNADGDPLPNIKINVYASVDDFNERNQVAWGLTDENGEYNAGGLSTGSYLVEFRDEDSGDYALQYYNGQATIEDADSVSVTVGAITPGVDAVLAYAGHITGTVTNADDDPLPNIKVNAYASEDDFNSGTQAAWGQTNEDGTYDLGGLSTGSYLVEFRDEDSGDYVAQFYNGQPTVEDADSVSVTVGVITPGVDAVLAYAGHITGTVTNADDDPLPNIKVNAYASVDDFNSGTQAAWGQTDEDGTYDLGGLSTGSYLVEFRDEESGDYIAQFYSGQATIEDADSVSVTAGTTTPGIDAELAPAGHITGTVTNVAGVGLTGVIASAYATLDDYYNGLQVGNAETRPDGSYDLGGLPSGDYFVEFYNESGDYIAQLYDGQATIDTATSVTVTAGDITPDIDAVLALAGRVAGTVTDATSHAGLADIEVSAYRSDGQGGWTRVANDVRTATDGTYDLGGLPAGNCRIQFDDYSGTYVRQFYDNALERDSGIDVSVTVGATHGGIDAALAVGGFIAGTVRDLSSLPILDVYVGFWRWDDASGDWVETAQTMNNVGTTGGYLSEPLLAGTYRVMFFHLPGDYGLQTWEHVITLEAGTNVPVTSGATTPNIDGDLGQSAHIRGRVTNRYGQPLKGVYVYFHAYEVGSWNELPWVSDTDANGVYDLNGVPAGTYRIEFKDPKGVYQSQYFNDVFNIEAAENVTVAAGGNRTGVDASLNTPDTTPPTTTVAGNDDAWHKTAVTLTLSATDEAGGSGMGGQAKTEYKIDSGVWTSGTSVVVPAPSDHSGDGARTVSYHSTDAVGNSETVKTVTVKIDTTPPTTTAGVLSVDSGSPVADGGSCVGPVSVTLTAADGTGSGMSGGQARTQYSTDGSTWTAYTAPFTVLTVGDTTVSFRSTDAVGNQSDPAGEVHFTLTPNTLIGSGETPTLPDNVGVTFSSVTGSGMTTVTTSTTASGSDPPVFEVGDQSFYQIETTATYTGPIAVALPYDPTGLTLEQQQALKIMHYDSGAWVDVTTSVDTTAHVIHGSVAHLSWFGIAVDARPPTTTVSGADDAWHNSPVALSFAAADNAGGSGMSGAVAKTEYQLDSGAWTSGNSLTVSTDGSHTVSYRSTDAAGNQESARSVSVKIDTNKPVCKGTKNLKVRKGKKVGMRFTVADAAPSCGSAQVAITIKRGRKVAKVIRLGDVATNTARTYSFKVTLKKGRYTWVVNATDIAGNIGKASAAKKLTVK